VRNLAGVRGIANRLEISPAKLAVNEVRQAIEEALERHAEREAKRIQLDVLDGSVVLSGVVESYGEREAIVGAAKGTRGVRRVDDRLRVAPA
jgi:hyperosmotically inducible protein